VAAFDSLKDSLRAKLYLCASGRELTERDFAAEQFLNYRERKNHSSCGFAPVDAGER
jgi:hypothetical protein